MTGEGSGTPPRPQRLRERIRGSRVLAWLIRAGMVVYMLQVGNVYYDGPAVIGPPLNAVLVAIIVYWSWVVFISWLQGRREWRTWRRRADQ